MTLAVVIWSRPIFLPTACASPATVRLSASPVSSPALHPLHAQLCARATAVRSKHNGIIVPADGPINSWSRLPYITPVRNGTASILPLARTIYANCILGTYSSQECIDNGSALGHSKIWGLRIFRPRRRSFPWLCRKTQCSA